MSVGTRAARAALLVATVLPAVAFESSSASAQVAEEQAVLSLGYTSTVSCEISIVMYTVTATKDAAEVDSTLTFAVSEYFVDGGPSQTLAFRPASLPASETAAQAIVTLPFGAELGVNVGYNLRRPDGSIEQAGAGFVASAADPSEVCPPPSGLLPPPSTSIPSHSTAPAGMGPGPAQPARPVPTDARFTG